MRVASFYVVNFGCRATQADGAAIERQFKQLGCKQAPGPEQAQIVILNTCTVTASADQDARAAVRRVKGQNPGAQIVVTGCYAQRAPQEIAALPGVSRVIGNSHKHQLARLVVSGTDAEVPTGSRPDIAAFPSQSHSDRVPGNTEAQNSFLPLDELSTESGQRVTSFVSDIFAHTELLAAPVFEAANERTRPNLKVQDGCGNRCSFCVIPYVRGHSRSLPREEVIRQLNALVASGYREVVISGINLGRWGRDLPVAGKGSVVQKHLSFEDLVQAILEGTDLEKLRISSVEPMDWSGRLIDLVASSTRIAKHAHVPMQSGSDRVLRAMHRKYRPWHYRQKIERIRAAMPAAAIGADVMVGFPGETDADFEQTRRMIEDLPFTYLHVFTYSSRPGTPASGMSGQVPVQIARERNRVLRELAANKKLSFMRNFIGASISAITLNVHDSEYTETLTDNYLKLRVLGSLQPNQWITGRVEEVKTGFLVGRVLPKADVSIGAAHTSVSSMLNGCF